MIRLLLISNSTMHGRGYLDHAESEIRELLEGVRDVLFVPFALRDHDEYAAKARTRFEAMGLGLEPLHQSTEPVRAVEKAEAIFIGGGNTFRLLRALYETRVLDPIRDRVAQGMPYLGSSAGANVAGAGQYDGARSTHWHPECSVRVPRSRNMRQSVRVVFGALSVFIFATGCARTPVTPDKPASVASAPAARPRPSTPAAPAALPDDIDMISVFFDFDSYVLRDDAGPPLQKIAAVAIQKHRSVRVEGHCDERGTPEYNLALGEGRARSVAQYLEHLGIPKEKMKAVSFGSQRPKSPGQDETAWSQNRRGDVKLE
jgi:peptidoglycan-associated lipoprotein